MWNQAVRGQQLMDHNAFGNYAGHDLRLALSTLIRVGGLKEWQVVSAWPGHGTSARDGQSNVARGWPEPRATRTPTDQMVSPLMTKYGQLRSDLSTAISHVPSDEDVLQSLSFTPV